MTKKTLEKEEPKAIQDEVYTLDEIIENGKAIFNSSEDIIRAAFALAEKEEATVKEAEKIINNFKRKEVR